MSNIKLTPAQVRNNVVALLSDGFKKEAAKILWPWLEQNEPMLKIWDALEQNDYIAIMGHGSAGKTFNCCAWFLLDWWTDSEFTSLTLTSATLDSLKARAWSDLVSLFTRTRVKMPGILVDSERMIKHSPIDRKNAISAIAADRKESQAKIQGLHTKRVRIIIDEADNRLSESIWAALANLSTSGEFKVVALANPVSKRSRFGMKVEPLNGWNGVNPDVDFEWQSKEDWKVLRLDGLQSPNIKAGNDIYPFLLTNKAVEKAKNDQNSREWWTYIRAWYPPDGTVSNIFTDEILSICKKPIVWYAETRNIAACDPAFGGGDRCMLGIAKMGYKAENPTIVGIEPQHYYEIVRKDISKLATNDIGDQIIALLKHHEVKPADFIIDSTTISMGLSDYIRNSIGKEVIATDFGGSPTEMVVSREDSRRACDRFDRFVSELWFCAREWCRLGHVYLKDPPNDLLIDLEAREFEPYLKTMIRIETKEEMKKRGLRSPDYGDMFCLWIHLLRIREKFMPAALPNITHVNPLQAFKKNRTIFTANYGVKDKQ